ncbi:MAG: glycosyltransferase 87 family protein [Chloroflexota bacterium]|nr:glycosyltransferase 87 family protein [Chloroflexota bacterium]
MRKINSILIVCGLGLVIVFAGVWLTYALFTSHHVGGNDFYSRWVGGCALLREGVNPYSEAVTLRIQVGMYGRPALPDEDQVAFAYPLYCLLFFWPLCFTDNYPLVQAIWMWLLLAGLIAALVLWMQVICWRPRLWLWALTMLWGVALYHNLRALFLGQFAVFVLLALVAALWAMQRGHDGWAGIFLALATVKPQLIYLALPWVLLWAAGKQRWRLWWGFGISTASLTVGAMILLPSWVPDFVRQAIAYPSYTVYGSLTWMIVQYWLGLGRAAEIVTLVVLALGVLVLGWRLWRGTWEQMVWMLGLLLLLTNFFTPRIATTNYLTLVPWALWGFRHVQLAWGRSGTWAVAAAEVISLVGLWALFLATVEGNFERAPVYFPFPVAIALLLAWLWRRTRCGDWGTYGRVSG